MTLAGRRHVVRICGYVASVILSCPASAISLDLQPSQLYHTSWTARDGAPTSVVALAQTHNGYLWIAAANGLFRFDGVHFERVEGTSETRLPSTSLYSLWVAPSGALWIGYRFGGASVMFEDGRLINYSEREGMPAGSVYGFEQDATGIMWAATTRGLMRLEGQHWVRGMPEMATPTDRNLDISADGSGTLWILMYDSVLFLRPGARSPERAAIKLLPNHVSRLIRPPDGTVWLWDQLLGFLELRTEGALAPGKSAPWAHFRATLSDMYSGWIIDRDGGFWRPTSEGMFRTGSPGDSGQRSANWSTDRRRPDPLSGTQVNSALEDREGNLWFGTTGGLDKYREPHLKKVDLPAGASYLGMTADVAGAMWIGDRQGRLYRFIDGQRGQQVASQTPLAITCLYRDMRGTLWIGGENFLMHSQTAPAAGSRARFSHFHDRHGFLKVGVQAMAIDGSGALWVSVPRAGVFRVAGGEWILAGGRSDLPREPATVLSTDPTGRLWLGYVRNRAILLDGTKSQAYSDSEGLKVGTVLALDAHSPHVWIGGEGGLARFDGRNFHGVTREDGRSFRAVSGIIETSNGDLWLNTGDGAVQIPAVEVHRLVADPNYRVHYLLFNYLDGMPGAPDTTRPLPTLAQDSIGRLWFATSSGVAWTDPGESKRNTLRPVVLIQSVTADGVRYTPLRELKFPVKSRNLQIAYTALSLSIPERVRFRYRLEGVDATWQEVGTRRKAYYTDLPPGEYRFRVFASNNDGLWNEAGATISMLIPPTFLQSRWFPVLCIFSGASLLWLLFQVRLRQVKASVRWRLEGCMVERERIARELHDTFLQGMQSLMLRFQSAAERIPEHEPARRLMEEALDRADDVLAEGRDRVTDLRTSTCPATELAPALQLVGDELMKDRVARFGLIVEGAPRALHPVASEEAYRIGSEAITNAFNHSGAARIDLTIIYERRHLTLRVTDDGHGFDPTALRERMSAGHWGMKGMHERAARIRGRLEVFSGLGSGTTVKLRVPGPIAYRPADMDRARKLSWLRAPHPAGTVRMRQSRSIRPPTPGIT